jgi:hypothetical protein
MDLCYSDDMSSIVQARLDDETQATLERISARLGWSTSRVLREGIHLVEERHSPSAIRKLIGIGAFGGGPRDLSTNKKYMADFGRKSMGRARKAKLRGSSK